MGDLLPAAAMLNAAVAAAMLLVANMASLSRALPRGSHTPLVNKDIPCAAENLKVRTNREGLREHKCVQIQKY